MPSASLTSRDPWNVTCPQSEIPLPLVLQEQQEEERNSSPVPTTPPSSATSFVTPPRPVPRPALAHRLSTGSSSPANLARTLEQSKEFLTSTLSPLRDAWQQMDLSGAAASLSSTLGLKTRKFSLGSKMASVTRSSTFHANHKASSARSSPARSTSQMESLVEQVGAGAIPGAH